MKKSIALATLIGLLLAGIVFQHYITGLPDLESPVRIEEARFNAQTGRLPRFIRCTRLCVNATNAEQPMASALAGRSDQAEGLLCPPYHISS